MDGWENISNFTGILKPEQNKVSCTRVPSWIPCDHYSKKSKLTFIGTLGGILGTRSQRDRLTLLLGTRVSEHSQFTPWGNGVHTYGLMCGGGGEGRSSYSTVGPCPTHSYPSEKDTEDGTRPHFYRTRPTSKFPPRIYPGPSESTPFTSGDVTGGFTRESIGEQKGLKVRAVVGNDATRSIDRRTRGRCRGPSSSGLTFMFLPSCLVPDRVFPFRLSFRVGCTVRRGPRHLNSREAWEPSEPLGKFSEGWVSLIHPPHVTPYELYTSFYRCHGILKVPPSLLTHQGTSDRHLINLRP